MDSSPVFGNRSLHPNSKHSLTDDTVLGTLIAQWWFSYLGAEHGGGAHHVRVILGSQVCVRQTYDGYFLRKGSYWAAHNMHGCSEILRVQVFWVSDTRKFRL